MLRTCNGIDLLSSDPTGRVGNCGTTYDDDTHHTTCPHVALEPAPIVMPATSPWFASVLNPAVTELDLAVSLNGDTGPVFQGALAIGAEGIRQTVTLPPLPQGGVIHIDLWNVGTTTPAIGNVDDRTPIADSIVPPHHHHEDGSACARTDCTPTPTPEPPTPPAIGVAPVLAALPAGPAPAPDEPEPELVERAALVLATEGRGGLAIMAAKMRADGFDRTADALADLMNGGDAA